MNLNFWAHKTAEIEKEAKIGKGTKVWQNCQIINGARIGQNCVIGHNCLIDSGAKIGNGVKIGSNVDVFDLVSLEDYVFVGRGVSFTNDINPRAKYPKPKYPKYGKWLPTKVLEGATIGANATIICGNKIGKWAMIGAGAVVTKDVPDYAVAVGVPAKAVGWICECGNKIVFSRQPEPHKTEQKEKAICKICKRKYQLKSNRVWQVK